MKTASRNDIIFHNILPRTHVGCCLRGKAIILLKLFPRATDLLGKFNSHVWNVVQNYIWKTLPVQCSLFPIPVGSKPLIKSHHQEGNMRNIRRLHHVLNISIEALSPGQLKLHPVLTLTIMRDLWNYTVHVFIAYLAAICISSHRSVPYSSYFVLRCRSDSSGWGALIWNRSYRFGNIFS